MTAQLVSALTLFAGAVCFLVGSAINLWMVISG
jgi:hypothetical protein